MYLLGKIKRVQRSFFNDAVLRVWVDVTLHLPSGRVKAHTVDIELRGFDIVSVSERMEDFIAIERDHNFDLKSNVQRAISTHLRSGSMVINNEDVIAMLSGASA